MTDPHTIEVLRPGRAVLDLLNEALAHEKRAYIFYGGSRDFRHEEAQDSAALWLRSVAVASKEKD